VFYLKSDTDETKPKLWNDLPYRCPNDYNNSQCIIQVHYVFKFLQLFRGWCLEIAKLVWFLRLIYLRVNHCKYLDNSDKLKDIIWWIHISHLHRHRHICSRYPSYDNPIKHFLNNWMNSWIMKFSLDLVELSIVGSNQDHQHISPLRKEVSGRNGATCVSVVEVIFLAKWHKGSMYPSSMQLLGQFLNWEKHVYNLSQLDNSSKSPSFIFTIFFSSSAIDIFM
jgi:hypothetical protein